jgi:hypothetical protein
MTTTTTDRTSRIGDFGIKAPVVVATTAAITLSGLQTIDGVVLTAGQRVLVKSGAATRRYMGTFYTTAATTTEDSAANRYLWNYYHRVRRTMNRIDATPSWPYSAGAIRQANGSTSNQLNFVIGVAEDSVSASLAVATANTSTAATPSAYIGLDSITASVSGLRIEFTTIQVATSAVQQQASYSAVIAAGRHYLSWLEANPGAVGTNTWYGTTSLVASGIFGEVMA